MPDNKYSLINANEDLIKIKVVEMMKKIDMCRCDKCYNDVCAIALNSVKSRYVTTIKGEKIATAVELGLENNTDLMVAVQKAIELVKNQPMH